MKRAIHLASFNGNIGDIVNHVGFWNLFKKYVNAEVQVDNIEIREFYKLWNIRQFDEEFVNLVNQYDFLVIGGGNYFDVKWGYSETGTTLNLPPSQIEKINIPIIFNGLGVDYSEETGNKETRKKFATYIKYLNDCQDKIVCSVRNDDSKTLLKKYFSGHDLCNVIQIPDGGFFTTAREYSHPEIPVAKKIISVNVAKDRVNDRWGDTSKYLLYCEEFARFINDILKKNKDFHFIFAPHIPTDIDAIFDILKNVKDYYRRKNISIAPYLNGEITPGDYLIDLYRKSDVTIGMRYHSNIGAIAMRTPTIGIVTLAKHKELYEEIGMGDRIFNVNCDVFAEKLYERVMCVLNNRDEEVRKNDELIVKLEKESMHYYERINTLLRR